MGLKLAIVHYHLRPGGVTRVIENAMAALARGGGGQAIGILSGEPAPPGFSLPDGAAAESVEGLGYGADSGATDAAALAGQLEEAAAAACDGAPDLWHFHNHNLGKNPALPEAVSLLAERGHRLLLQIHDFPEDGRPGNYAALPNRWALYPVGSRVHYAALNSRDLGALGEAGIPSSRLHLLPNPVHLEFDFSTRERREKPAGAPRLLFYPTRAIRRKNLGEVLLLAALMGNSCHFATSKAPENPEWLPVYERWRAFASRHDLPMAFAVAGETSPRDLGLGSEEGTGFDVWLGCSDAIVTTSIAEGFGLAFLEPFLLPRPLVGRDLPEITSDMVDAGLRFPGLYERLEAPLEWVGEDRLRADLEEAMAGSAREYGRPCGARDVETAFTSMVREGRVEFGRLHESHQEAIIEAVIGGGREAAARVLLRTTGGEDSGAAEWLMGVLERPPEGHALAANAAAVRESYSAEGYGRLLEGCYRRVVTEGGESGGSPERPVSEALLDFFLDGRRFCFLRS